MKQQPGEKKFKLHNLFCEQQGEKKKEELQRDMRLEKRKNKTDLIFVLERVVRLLGFDKPHCSIAFYMWVSLGFG